MCTFCFGPHLSQLFQFLPRMMLYFVILKVSLMQVFSAFGFVQKIAIFEKSAGFQALVQYPGILVLCLSCMDQVL